MVARFENVILVMKTEKIDLNYICDGFMNDCINCSMEQEFLDAILNDDIIVSL